MYDRILVPTDGSDVAEAAAAHAVALAADSGAEVHVLYVVDADAIGLVRPSQLDADELASSMEAEGETVVASVAAAAEDAGVEAVTAIRAGVPDEEITDYATEADVDLVVMGTHGRSGLGRFLLGSVTERVVRGSRVPVLAVPPGEAEAVLTAEEAIERATDAVEAEGETVAGLRDDPYRERTTWVVPVDLAEGGVVNVHVDATTGRVRTARLG